MKFYNWLGIEDYLKIGEKNILGKYMLQIDDIRAYSENELNELLEKIYKCYWNDYSDKDFSICIEGKKGKKMIRFCESKTKNDINGIPFVFYENQEKYYEKLKVKYNKYLRKKERDKIIDDMEKKITSIVRMFGMKEMEDIRYEYYKILKFSLTKEKVYDYYNVKCDIDDYEVPFIYKKDTFPVYGRLLHRVLFGKHITLFNDLVEKSEKEDITRYGFRTVCQIIKEMKVEKEKDFNNYKKNVTIQDTPIEAVNFSVSLSKKDFLI